MGNEYISALVDLAEAYFSKTLGLSEDWATGTEVYVGPQERVTEVCGQECYGCNIYGRIVVSESGNVCQEIVHEMGHSACNVKWNDWDGQHKRLDYAKILEACDE